MLVAPDMQPLSVPAPWSAIGARGTAAERFYFGYADDRRTRFDLLLLIKIYRCPRPGDSAGV